MKEEAERGIKIRGRRAGRPRIAWALRRWDTRAVPHEGHAAKPEAAAPVAAPAPASVAPAAPAFAGLGGFTAGGATPSQVVALSRSAGNAAVARAVASGTLV